MLSNRSIVPTESLPFLLSLRVADPSGNPVEGAQISLWQASGAGKYAFGTYALRGTCSTGHDGNVEILTVAPGKYGPEKYKRAGHVHAIIHPPKDRKDLDKLVTQIYVCKANDEKELGTDLCVLTEFISRPLLRISWDNSVKVFRSTRTANLVHGYSTVPDQPAMDLPVLEKSRTDLEERVHDWDSLIQANGGDGVRAQIVAQHEIKLNKKFKWF